MHRKICLGGPKSIDLFDRMKYDAHPTWTIEWVIKVLERFLEVYVFEIQCVVVQGLRLDTALDKDMWKSGMR